MSAVPPVRAVQAWPTNADLIFDCWRLGYVHGDVYDATPGSESLWTRLLVSPASTPLLGIRSVSDNLWRDDFRDLTIEDESFDTVLFDPPYKLNGTPAMGEMDKRYGIEVPTSMNERLNLIHGGFTECARILRHKGHLLVKCQDQVCSGRMVWQTDGLTTHGILIGLHKVDRFDMLGHSIPQPMAGRRQRHAHGRGSTLLVLQKAMG